MRFKHVYFKNKSTLTNKKITNSQLYLFLGSRNLSGSRNEPEEFDHFHGLDDPFDEEFVSNHKRIKERASAAFEEDMAEIRRKRRDMQVIFYFNKINSIFIIKL